MTKKIKKSVHKRPSWDEYFLEMAGLVAKRSTWAAIILRDGGRVGMNIF
ncbi:MAG: hypothetical protein NT014_00585 [Candidatus Omnitrophica bacterium]|nr:hypothetical protein [Candidatus Omnitrophota bacterium]